MQTMLSSSAFLITDHLPVQVFIAQNIERIEKCVVWSDVGERSILLEKFSPGEDALLLHRFHPLVLHPEIDKKLIGNGC